MRISDWSSDVCSSDLLVRLVGPLLVRSPKTARYLPYITALLWVCVALLAADGLAAAGAIVAVFGGLGLAAMRFLSAFRAESAAQDRARHVIRSFGWLLLALFPWLLDRKSTRLKSRH